MYVLVGSSVAVGCGVSVGGTIVVGIKVFVIVIVAVEVEVLLETAVGLDCIVLVVVDTVLDSTSLETDASFSMSPLNSTELLGNQSSVSSSGTTI